MPDCVSKVEPERSVAVTVTPKILLGMAKPKQTPPSMAARTQRGANNANTFDFAITSNPAIRMPAPVKLPNMMPNICKWALIKV